MKIYNFTDYDNVLVMGDIHGEFKTLLYNLKRISTHNKRFSAINDADKEFNYKRHGYTRNYSSLNFNNSILFVAGDCGFGFNKDEYYKNELNRLNIFLIDCNSHIFFIRGNHDDPRFFNEDILNFSNIHCIPDYSIVKTKNFTTLCIGGALSIDRMWRKKEEERINSHRNKDNLKKLYWEDEMPVFDSKKLKSIKDSKIKIDSVITHTSPSFARQNDKSELIEWIKIDSKLKNDINNEIEIMDKIFNSLIDNYELKFWAYGHFHLSSVKKHYGVIFFALNDEMDIINPIEENKKYDNMIKVRENFFDVDVF